jgi:hypothetical protein
MMELASDIGPAPRQVGAILRFAPGMTLDFDEVKTGVADRIGRIRRLRQLLSPTPWGCGRPVWVDDPAFDIANHVHRATCRAPDDESALLATAAELLTSPLSRDHPLWTATLMDGIADGGCALVAIFHHVLADGMGGLAMLASLVDDGQPAPVAQTASVLPSRSALAYDAAVSRLRVLAHVGEAPSTIRAALAELRSGSTPRAARSSLNRPLGPRRTMATVRADLGWVRTLAHAQAAERERRGADSRWRRPRRVPGPSR